jgi:hypothetical protein
MGFATSAIYLVLAQSLTKKQWLISRRLKLLPINVKE